MKAGHNTEVFDFPTELDVFLTKYKTYDLVIPMFHGVYGEDGQVTAFLQTLVCPYAYSSHTVHALCIDKHLTNQILANIGVNIPRTLYLKEGNHIPILKSPLVYYSVIVKPNK